MLRLVLIILVVASPAWACLWDNDTLREEQRGLPTVANIIAGKWERHSAFYYEHRLQQSKAILVRDPKNLAAMDDLGVSLEKLGRVDEAIAVMLDKLEIDPDGYTTHANLGTFYLHAGKWDDGIRHIDRAIEINPNAHFGREKYQALVARHIRDAGDKVEKFDESFVIPLLLPEFKGDAEDRKDQLRYLRMGMKIEADPKEIDAAIEGIVGMIRFGTGTSAHLYYALGDLLAAKRNAQMAAWAYRRALHFKHPRSETVREAMESARGRSEHGTDDATFAAEEKAAADWVAAFQAFEDNLIRQGKDVTDEGQFAPFYKQHGDIRSAGFRWGDLMPRKREHRLVAGILLAVVAAVAWDLFRKQRKARANKAIPPRSSKPGIG